MRQSLKISNEESDDLEGMLNGAGAMLSDPEPGVAGKKRFLATPTAANSRALLDALYRTFRLHVEKIKKVQAELTELAQTEYAPAPLINGDDLTTGRTAPPARPSSGRWMPRTMRSWKGKSPHAEAAMQLAMEIIEIRESKSLSGGTTRKSSWRGEPRAAAAGPCGLIYPPSTARTPGDQWRIANSRWSCPLGICGADLGGRRDVRTKICHDVSPTARKKSPQTDAKLAAPCKPPPRMPPAG